MACRLDMGVSHDDAALFWDLQCYVEFRFKGSGGLQ